MNELIVKNGFVFDPLQGIKGDRMDIGIKDGKFVETSALGNPKVIDAAGKTVRQAVSTSTPTLSVQR